MYSVLEHKAVVRTVPKLQPEIKKNYQAWKRIVELEGPQGLRLIKGFHDEALKGEWRGYRSSRLSKGWRVIYTVEKDKMIVYAVEINHHEY